MPKMMMIARLALVAGVVLGLAACTKPGSSGADLSITGGAATPGFAGTGFAPRPAAVVAGRWRIQM